MWYDKLEAESVDGMVATAPPKLKADMELLGAAFDQMDDSDVGLESLATPENIEAMDKVFDYVDAECDAPR